MPTDETTDSHMPDGQLITGNPDRDYLGSFDHDPRHSAVPVRELIVRALVVIAAVTVTAIGAPAVLAVPLVLLATVSVVERVVRFRRRGLLDAVLTGTAMTISALVLLGLLLDLLPVGLTRQSWAVGVGVLGLLALACCLRRDEPPSMLALIAKRTREGGRLRPAPYTLVCVVASVAVIAASIVLVAASSEQVHIPPVELSSASGAAGTAEITIASGTPGGPYSLLVQSAGGVNVVATGISTEAGSPMVIPITVPAGHVLVNLVPTDSTEPIRQLIFDDGLIAGDN